eukprot:3517040-Pyramimonas_sp.AAC.2
MFIKKRPPLRNGRPTDGLISRKSRRHPPQFYQRGLSFQRACERRHTFARDPSLTAGAVAIVHASIHQAIRAPVENRLDHIASQN